MNGGRTPTIDTRKSGWRGPHRPAPPRWGGNGAIEQRAKWLVAEGGRAAQRALPHRPLADEAGLCAPRAGVRPWGGGPTDERGQSMARWYVGARYGGSHPGDRRFRIDQFPNFGEGPDGGQVTAKERWARNDGQTSGGDSPAGVVRRRRQGAPAAAASPFRSWVCPTLASKGFLRRRWVAG